MATDNIASILAALRADISANTKKQFLRDLEGQIEESLEIERILQSSNNRTRYLAVSCDRKRNDTVFSYQYFDLLLVLLDAASGGSGIYKPVNQIRVLQWNKSKRKLLTVLRYFARNNPEVRFKSVLILPFPVPTTGCGTKKLIYKR